jgi:hypothetical protein
LFSVTADSQALFPTEALGKRLRVFRLIKAEHREDAVIGSQGVRDAKPGLCATNPKQQGRPRADFNFDR